MNIENWIAQIITTPSFVKRLDDYNLDETEKHLNAQITELSNQLEILRLKNPTEKMWFPQLVSYRNALDIVRKEQIRRIAPDKFKRKNNSERKANGKKGGEAKGENKYNKWLLFIHKKKIDLNLTDNSIAEICTRKGFPITNKTVSKYMGMLSKEK
jgi:hypothetical protein